MLLPPREYLPLVPKQYDETGLIIHLDAAWANNANNTVVDRFGNRVDVIGNGVAYQERCSTFLAHNKYAWQFDASGNVGLTYNSNTLTGLSTFTACLWMMANTN